MQGSDECSLGFWAAFKGSAYGVRFTPVASGEPGTPRTIPVARKATAVADFWVVADLAIKEYTWKVALVDRKGNVLGSEITTTAEWWVNPNSCPASGVLAGFPAWAYPTPTFQSVCAGLSGAYLENYSVTAPACRWSGISSTDYDAAKVELRGFCPVYTYGQWFEEQDPDYFGCTSLS